MKHFNIGDKVKVVQSEEKPWTYDWTETYYIVGIDLPRKPTYNISSNYVDEYDVEYTIAEDYPTNKY